MTLIESRKEWEKGLTPVTVMCIDDVVLVILKKGDKYHCHRYFEINNKWGCSVDGRDLTVDAVFSWLNHPSAMSTIELIQPETINAANLHQCQ